MTTNTKTKKGSKRKAAASTRTAGIAKGVAPQPAAPAAIAERPIPWESFERPPVKRWWWYAAFGYIAFAGTVILLSLDQWTFAAVTTVAAFAVILVYLSGPRTVHAELTTESLTVNGQRFLLAGYHRYRIIPTGQAPSLVLIPRRRLRLSVTVPLAGDPALDQCIQDRLDITLDYDGSDEDFFDKIVRWSRLG